MRFKKFTALALAVVTAASVAMTGCGSRIDCFPCGPVHSVRWNSQGFLVQVLSKRGCHTGASAPWRTPHTCLHILYFFLPYHYLLMLERCSFSSGSILRSDCFSCAVSKRVRVWPFPAVLSVMPVVLFRASASPSASRITTLAPLLASF